MVWMCAWEFGPGESGLAEHVKGGPMIKVEFGQFGPSEKEPSGGRSDRRSPPSEQRVDLQAAGLVDVQ